MRWLMLLLPGLPLSPAGHAEVLAGKLADPDGNPVAQVIVFAKNVQTGAVSQVTSDTAGSYRFADLAAGDYDVSVPLPCCFYSSFPATRVNVAPKAEKSFVIAVPWGTNLGTLGDDPLGALNTIRGKPATGPVPRLASGEPDLNGVWLSAPVPAAQTVPAPLQPWAAALVAERTKENNKDFPPNYCLPAGPNFLTPGFPYKLVHTPKLLVVLTEQETPGFRQVFLDGRKNPHPDDPTWYGFSTGKWDGEWLVIETTGLNDKTWLSFFGMPHTEQLRVVQRIRRVDRGHLEIETTMTDPGAFTAPWVRKGAATLAPGGTDLIEFVCNENNRDIAHIVGR